MTRPKSPDKKRARGRKAGMSAATLAEANNFSGLGIILCKRCGDPVRDHATLVCDRPLDEEVARREAGLPVKARTRGQ